MTHIAKYQRSYPLHLRKEGISSISVEPVQLSPLNLSKPMINILSDYLSLFILDLYCKAEETGKGYDENVDND